MTGREVLIIGNPKESFGTTAYGGMPRQRPNFVVVVYGVFDEPGTSTNDLIDDGIDDHLLDWTSAGRAFLPEGSHDRDSTQAVDEPNELTRVAINQLKRLSGLTWDQLGRVFGVSRRSLHLWASGKPLSASNEERLHQVLETIKLIDRGTAGQNRSILLSVTGGVAPIDLLASGQYEEAVDAIGRGSALERPQLTSLSADASADRKPPRPDVLVDARHEAIHREGAKTRGVRAVRAKK